MLWNILNFSVPACAKKASISRFLNQDNGLMPVPRWVCKSGPWETRWHVFCFSALEHNPVPVFSPDSNFRRFKTMMANILSRFLDILCVAGFVYLATFL